MTIPKVAPRLSIIYTAYRDSCKQHRFEELLVGVCAVGTLLYI